MLLSFIQFDITIIRIIYKNYSKYNKNDNIRTQLTSFCNAGLYENVENMITMKYS